MPDKINLDLTALNGNAYNLMGHFRHQARREGWTNEEIEKVLTEAKESDYHNLVRTLSKYCEVQDDG